MTLALPGATWKPIRYRLDAGLMVPHPLGWILHVQDGHGSPFTYFDQLVHPDRKFSHGWVAKDGALEQYQDTLHESWAMGDGNPAYWSFETEGMPDEPLTDAQIHTLAVVHNALGVPDRLAEAPGQLGVGTHYMGAGAWGGHTCPDPVAGAGPRSRQRPAIIAAARRLRSQPPDGVPVANESPLTLSALASWDVSGLCGEPSPLSFQDALGRIYKWTKAEAQAAHPAPAAPISGAAFGVQS